MQRFTGRRRMFRQFSHAALSLPPAMAALHIGAPSAREMKSTATTEPNFRPLSFPKDHGAHPDHRIEWWYLTAWLDANTGVQATIFRAKLGTVRPSRWGSNQWLMGHAALVRKGWSKLIHEQAAWRCVENVAGFSLEDLALTLPGWRMQRLPDGAIDIQIEQGRLKLALRCRPTVAPQLQGLQGYSQKGPQRKQFSHYYSLTQLGMQASVKVDDKRIDLEPGSTMAAGWFDHEWSDSLLAPEAVGWDWFGLNFLDGSAWMGFRIRDQQAGELWLSEKGLIFETLERWRSPSSGAYYPVALRVRSHTRQVILRPLLFDQEIDARSSTGNRYWEGAVLAYNDQNQVLGRGYLELTGYDRAMRI